MRHPFRHLRRCASPAPGPVAETGAPKHGVVGRHDRRSHATPAAFGAHAASRDDLGRIVEDYLARTHPNVLFRGGGSDEMPAGLAAEADNTFVTERAGLRDPEWEAADPGCGLFGGEHLPYERDGLGRLSHLSEMIASALFMLGGNPEGFFRIAEGGA